MLCPFCSHQISPVWNYLFTEHDEFGRLVHDEFGRDSSKQELQSSLPCDYKTKVTLEWARCGNEDCHQILVKVVQRLYAYTTEIERDEWFAVPRRTPPPQVDALVPDEPFAR